jgi:teichuronic acid biosynthesis glycosyltransferase TuaC
VHVLTFTSLFPNGSQPVHGLFIRNRMENFTKRFGHRWTVVAPVPWFPRLPFKVKPLYDAYARVPALEDGRGYPVHHPRYLVTPVVGMRHYGAWMAKGAAETVRRIHAENPIDVIDAHYVYPDGTAARRLGRELGVPVVLSARGTDLNLFTKMPDIVPLIRENLRDSRRVICVSSALGRIAAGHGAVADRLDVIGNGIDPALFHPRSQAESRKALGLPEGVKVILSVGHLVELKGFHFALQAVAALGRKDVMLAVVGEGPQRAELEAMAARLGMGDRFRLPGAVAQDRLPAWYAAADLFALMSSREGWPNVVCEAQAMGLPVLATRVGGVEDLVAPPAQGALLPERSTAALADALRNALDKRWDREAIAAAGQARTWDAVSDRLEPVFAAAMGAAGT